MASIKTVAEEADEYEPPKCLKNLRWYFMEYCNNTSIHGFKYLGERRSSVEKLWWVIVLSCSLYFCVDFMTEAYHKWQRSPVIVSFATSETPIWNVPFPAITICPRTKAIKSKYNFTKVALLINENKENYSMWNEYNYMSMVCPSQLDLFVDNETAQYINREIINFLIEVHPTVNYSVVNCSWMGRNCDDKLMQYFVPTVTSEGVCFSFNMLDKDEIFTSHMTEDYSDRKFSERQPNSEWTLEEGYLDDATLKAFPRRTLIVGPNGGLDLTFMTLQSDLDYLCGDALQGYDVILHHPAQMPVAKAGYFRVGLNQDVVAAVKPNMMRTSDELQRYSAYDRNCYFVEDRKLRFFKVYNQQDCLIECLANFTLATCGCVEFYMPRDNLTSICGAKQRICVKYAGTKFLESEVSFQIENGEENEENLTKHTAPNCNCLQSCNSLSYDASISQSDWDWKKGKRIVSSKNETDGYNLSRLRIYFKDMQFITSQRNELYGKTDFFANCGGLLGLFTGFSIISLAEIVYFATLRFTCNFRKHGRHYWSGAKELMNDPKRHD
ncbi:pickpocket protein 28-like [Photinus pyralis]|nr:pickpocket protein 28-like [Photinus pyralis]